MTDKREASSLPEVRWAECAVERSGQGGGSLGSTATLPSTFSVASEKPAHFPVPRGALRRKETG